MHETTTEVTRIISETLPDDATFRVEKLGEFIALIEAARVAQAPAAVG